MIFGCLFTLLALIFTFVILIIVGVSITFGLLIKVFLPFILIGIGINIILNNKKH